METHAILMEKATTAQRANDPECTAPFLIPLRIAGKGCTTI